MFSNFMQTIRKTKFVIMAIPIPVSLLIKTEEKKKRNKEMNTHNL